MYGAYLKAARETAGLSPVQMAAEIGYRSADMIYKIERDAADASLEQLDKWATACGRLLGDVLPNTGGSSLDEHFRPLIAALLGLTDEEIREQVLILASQTALNRNAILRRVGREMPSRDTPLSGVQSNHGRTLPVGSGMVDLPRNDARTEPHSSSTVVSNGGSATDRKAAR